MKRRLRRVARATKTMCATFCVLLAAAPTLQAHATDARMRVAVFATADAKAEYSDALSQLNWKADAYENSTAGWAKFAQKPGATDIVLVHGSMSGLDAVTATNIISFVKAGGALVITAAEPLTSDSADGGWLEILAPKSTPVITPFNSERDKKIDSVSQDRSILYAPNSAKNPSEAVGPTLKVSGRDWEVAGKVRGQPCVIQQRMEKGFIIISTARYNDTDFLENVAYALSFSRLGTAFIRCAYEYPRDSRTAETTFGDGKVVISLANTSGTNLNVRATVDWKTAEASRTALCETRLTRQGNFNMTIKSYLDLRGEGEYTVSLENLDSGEKVVVEREPFSCQPFLAVIPPASFNGIISTARRDPAVHFEVLLSPFKSQRVDGLEIEASVLDAKGAVLGTAKRSASSAGYMDFAIDIPRDAPAGDYTITAKALRDGIFEEKSEARFKIIPVRPGQIVIDQDGVMLADGKPFFPIATYHAHSWQLEDDVEGLATNKHGAKGWHDMGFNMMTIWPWDYYGNISTNEADILAYQAGQGAATNMAWFVERNSRNLERYRELGIRLVLEDGPWTYVVRNGSCDIWTGNEKNNERRKNLINAPENLFAGLYDFDEAHGTPRVIDAQGRWTEFFHSQDENHPTMGLGSVEMAWTCDIPGCEVYPVYGGGNGPLTPVAERLDDFFEFTRGKKAVPLIHQCFGDNTRGASEKPEQVRAMTYLGYTHGAKGIFWYCWKQTGDWSGAQSQGMGWHPDTYTEVKKLIEETKIFCMALLEPGARKLKSNDGKIHAIICGSEATGRFLVYVNGGYDVTESDLETPELDGLKLAPLFGGAQAAVKNGKLRLKVPGLGTGAFLIGHDPAKPLPESCQLKLPEWVLTGKFAAPKKTESKGSSLDAFKAILVDIADPAKEAGASARLLQALKDFVPGEGEAAEVVGAVCGELARLGKKELLDKAVTTVSGLQYATGDDVKDILARHRAK